MKKFLANLIVVTLTIFFAGCSTGSSLSNQLASDGYYVESEETNNLLSAINESNSIGIAYVQLNRDTGGQEAENLAQQYLETVEGSSVFETVVVTSNDGIGVYSNRIINQFETDQIIVSAIPFLEDRDYESALNQINRSYVQLTGISLGSFDNSNYENSDTSEGGSSFSLLTLLVPLGLLFLVFMGFQSWRNKKKFQERRAKDLLDDKKEIEQQLLDNADKVIDLGDRVIGHGDAELIDFYEKASATYQNVSRKIEDASTAEEIDNLDDQIDEAEWQFEVIEAKLDGEKPPLSPKEKAEKDKLEKEKQAKKLNRPALEQDESVFNNTSTRSSGGFGRQRNRNGGLGGLLGGILMGGGGGFGGPSRRTQRRGGGFGMSGGRRSRGGGSGRSFGSGKSRGGSGRSF